MSSKDLYGRNRVAECTDCNGRIFPTFGFFEKHREYVHGDAISLKCIETTCVGGTFQRKSDVISHWRRMVCWNGSSTEDGSVNSTDTRRGRLLNCLICDAFAVGNGFESESTLAAHISQVHQAKILNKNADCWSPHTLPCSLCHACESHTSEAELKEHIQLSHVAHLYSRMLGEPKHIQNQLLAHKIHRCDRCNRIFRIRESFHQHVGACKTVDTNFTKVVTPSTSFLIAATAHSHSIPLPEMKKMKPPISPQKTAAAEFFICELCQKAFSRKSILNVHRQMVHKSPMHNATVIPATTHSAEQSPKKLMPDQNGADAKDNDKTTTKSVNGITDKTKSKAVNGINIENKEAKKLKLVDFVDADDYVKARRDLCLAKHNKVSMKVKKTHESSVDEKTVESGKDNWNDELEKCIYEGCERIFSTYFSMMRHVAYTHRPKRLQHAMYIRPNLSDSSFAEEDEMIAILPTV